MIMPLLHPRNSINIDVQIYSLYLSVFDCHQKMSLYFFFDDLVQDPSFYLVFMSL